MLLPGAPNNPPPAGAAGAGAPNNPPPGGAGVGAAGAPPNAKPDAWAGAVPAAAGAGAPKLNAMLMFALEGEMYLSRA